jgi:hypothetical protein
MPFSTFYPNYVIVEQQHLHLFGGLGGDFLLAGQTQGARPSTTTGQKRKRKIQEDHTPMMGKT